MPNFTPPPTYADPVLVDEVTGRGQFNPIWLKWFLDLSQFISINGGGGLIQHNSTGGLQGGGTGEYFHLTNAQHTDLTAGFTGTGVLVRQTNPAITNPTITNGRATGLDYTGFSNTPTLGTIVPGTVSWDDGNGTLSLNLKGGNVDYLLGEQEFARVYNDTAATLTKGQIVYIAGAQGNRIAVKLAQANNDTNSAHTIGIVAESITAGGEGWVQISGPIYKLNTFGTIAGSTVYLSPTTPGAWTTTKPAAPDHLVVIGFIERVHATVGSIFIKVDNGYELEELHNVKITSVADKDLLQYDSAGPYWKNVAPSSVNIGTATNLSGGAVGSIPYQSAVSTTTFLSIGTADQVLAVNSVGTALEWDSSTGTGSIVRATSPTLITPLLGTPTSGNFSTGTFTWPTFNQNTTGTAAGLSTTLAVTSGGTGTSTAFTQGSVVFAGASGVYSQNNAQLFWDNTNSRLGIGTAAPGVKLDVVGTIRSNTTTYPNYQYNSTNRMAFGETAVPPAETGSVVQFGSGASSRNMVFAFTKTGVNTSFFGNDGTQMMLGSEGAAPITFRTGLSYGAANIIASGTEAIRITSANNVGIGTTNPVNKLQVNGSIGRNAPVTKAASFTLAATENWLICNGTATITVTFPAASSWTGREVLIKNIAAFTVVSASSNIVPLIGGAAGTAILAATAGAWATLVSDGTNWVIMQGN